MIVWTVTVVDRLARWCVHAIELYVEVGGSTRDVRVWQVVALVVVLALRSWWCSRCARVALVVVLVLVLVLR